jgi:hypothetical protein
VNDHHTNIFPSFCTITFVRVLLNQLHTSKEESIDQSAFNLTMFFADCQLKLQKSQPIIILPLFCISIVYTDEKYHERLKEESIDHPVFSLTTLLTVCQL